MSRATIEKINQKLEGANQKIRIDSIEVGGSLILSNGIKLNGNDRRVFFRRMRTKKHDLWLKNADLVYGTNAEVSENAKKAIINKLFSKNAKANWEKNRDHLVSKMLGRTSWNKGLKMSASWVAKIIEYQNRPEVKKRLSESRVGEKNPFYGRRHTEKTKRDHSNRIKRMILNNEFTPNSNNRNTHWDSFYDGKRYRSSWEALYQAIDTDSSYEELRLEYQYKENTHIYIVDFINHNTRKIIEVRPNELLHDDKTQAKVGAAKKWADENGYEFIVADHKYLVSHPMPNMLKFDKKTKEKVQKLYETYHQKSNR